MKTKCLTTLVIASILTGCAGLELRASTGIHRVDNSEGSYSTREKNTVPFRCMFWGCNEAQDQSQGS